MSSGPNFVPEREVDAGGKHEVGCQLPVASSTRLEQLQRTVGNRRLTSLLRRVQAKLEVGSVNDPFEAEADAISADVVRYFGSGGISSRGRSASQGSGVGRVAALRRSSASDVGAEGGLVDGSTESAINSLRGGGDPLSGAARQQFEAAFGGVDFSAVRVHTGSEASAINERIQAKAFTLGQDIFFRGRPPDPSSAAGQHLLAHELVHTIQQAGGTPQRDEPEPLPIGEVRRSAPAAVQRAVGFEFEDQTWTVFEVQPGRDFRTSNEIEGGEIAAPASEKNGEEEYKGVNIWKAPGGGSHINERVGRFNLRTAPKKGALHEGKGYKIEPDGPYSDHGVTNRMDLEIVTDPFPETPKGYEDLLAALDDLTETFERYSNASSGEWNGADFELNRFVTPAQHKFSRPNVYLYGGARSQGFFKTQVTGGIRLGDLSLVMATLGASADEPIFHSAVSAPIRSGAYGSDQPKDLAKGSSIIALEGRAPLLAGDVVSILCHDEIIDSKSDGLRDLQGFLSLVIVYIAALSGTTKDGIKTEIPLLSRLSISDLWRAIPEPLRVDIAVKRDQFFRALNPSVSTAIHEFLLQKFGSDEWAEKNAVEGLKGKMLRVRIPSGYGQAEQRQTVEKLLTSFTRLQWLDEVLNGRDLLTPAGLLGKLAEGDMADESKGYDKSVAVFLRGHGDTTNVKDVEGQEDEDLAILENRNVSAGPMTFAEAKRFASTYFKWLAALRGGDTPLL